jgi:adenosyl cobinamide kinase/adenosyl cobinamide phosphate guanylyltransferase
MYRRSGTKNGRMLFIETCSVKNVKCIVFESPRGRSKYQEKVLAQKGDQQYILLYILRSGTVGRFVLVAEEVGMKQIPKMGGDEQWDR